MHPMNTIGDAGAHALVASPNLPRLKSHRLCENEISAVEAVRAAAPSRLEVDLRNNPRAKKSLFDGFSDDLWSSLAELAEAFP